MQTNLRYQLSYVSRFKLFQIRLLITKTIAIIPKSIPVAWAIPLHGAKRKIKVHNVEHCCISLCTGSAICLSLHGLTSRFPWTSVITQISVYLDTNSNRDCLSRVLRAERVQIFDRQCHTYLINNWGLC